MPGWSSLIRSNAVLNNNNQKSTCSYYQKAHVAIVDKSQGQEAVCDREARLCRRIERYAERRARETPQEKRERLSNRRERDAITCSSRLTACTSLFRNMKLNAIAQSGSPPNVLHSLSYENFNTMHAIVYTSTFLWAIIHHQTDSAEPNWFVQQGSLVQHSWFSSLL